jgi:hypothetical protein
MVLSMKRSLSLIVLAAICVLALAVVTSLSGCSTKAPDNDPTGSIDAPDPAPAVTGETATYTSGYVDMALTIPEGWQWEAVQRSGTTTEGIRFWKTDNKALDFELLCWRNGYGICGTDVTSEELTLSGGQKVWQHTEESDDGLWLNLYFESVPGDYVCQFADSVLDKAAWEAGRDEVLAILGTAQFGRDAMTEQAAIDAAAAQYDGEYDMAYGRYSVVDGCWTVTFSKGAAGENSKSFKITPQGSVTAAE